MEREGKKEMTTSKDVLGELLESVMNIAGGDDGTEVTQVLSDLADVILKDKDVADVNRTAERRQQNSTSQHKIRLTEKELRLNAVAAAASKEAGGARRGSRNVGKKKKK